uniref:Uncharacterized protein n=1 Tax=Clytia hemisphaerica TaxID=252671 RepID=A0A7M5XG57_9CNID
SHAQRHCQDKEETKITQEGAASLHYCSARSCLQMETTQSIDHGNTDYVVNLGKLLNDPSSVDKRLTPFLVSECRNLLIFIICQGNAARSSNKAEMTLQHIDEAVKSSDYVSNGYAMVVKSEKYKTSLIYGEKLLVIPNAVFHQIKMYIEHLRPIIIKDEALEQCDRFLFNSTKAGKKQDKNASRKMTSSLVASACTSLFIKCGFGDKSSSKRCSPTRIRHAIATELAGHDQEKLETVSRIFMQNRPTTTAKFYIMHFQQRESVRLSMKLYEKTRGNFNPELIPKPNDVSKDEEQT